MSERDQDLIARWLDGRASAAEVAELDARLVREPALARALLSAAGTESDCRRLLRRPQQTIPDLRAGTTTGRIREYAAQTPAPAATRPRRAGALRPRATRRVRRTGSRRTMTALVPVVAVTFVIGLVLVLWPSSAAGPSALATTQQPLWVERAGSRLQTTTLLPGDALAGVVEAELAMGDGSRLRLHDAHLRLPAAHDGGVLLLDGGTLHLSARSPRWEVTTPHLQVRVTGTAYRLEVDGQGSSLSVESGQVQLRAVQPSVGAWETVVAGEQRRVGVDKAKPVAEGRWQRRWQVAMSSAAEFEHGRWQADAANEQGSVHSVPRNIRDPSDGQHYPGQSMASTPLAQPLPRFGPGHRVVLRVRSSREQQVNVMLMSSDPASGDWLANLIAKPRLSGGESWQELTLDWDAFIVRVPPERVAALADAGLPVARWNLHALVADGLMEVSEFAIEEWVELEP